MSRLFVVSLFFILSSNLYAQVETNFTAGGAVRVGDSSTNCAPAIEGAIRFDADGADTLDYCDGANWLTLLTSAVGGAIVNNGNSFAAPMVIGTNDANSLSFETSGTTRVTIDASGNVGIGTTTPNYKLSVNDYMTAWALDARRDSPVTYSPTADLGDGGAVTLQNLNNTNSSGAKLSFDLRNSSGNAQWAAITGISTAGAGSYAVELAIQQKTGVATYAERLRIDSSGNVGIGTTVPTEKLDVEGRLLLGPKGILGGDGGSILMEELAGNGTNVTGFRAPDALGANLIYELPGTAPSAGQVLSSDASGFLSWVNQTATIPADSLNWSDFSDAMTLDATTTIDMDTNAADLNFDANTLFIDSSLNRIGIGSATPQKTLDIVGDIISTHSLTVRRNSGAGIEGLTIDNSNGGTVNPNSTLTFESNGLMRSRLQGGPDGTATSGYLAFLTRQGGTPTEVMRMNSSGNVGIGTTAPGFGLEVHKDAGATGYAAFIRRSSTAGGLAFGTLPATDIGFIQGLDDDYSTPRDIVLQAGGGYVGIGTTTPLAELDVQGSILSGPKGTLAGDGGAIRLQELSANGTNATGFRAPDALAADAIYQLPSGFPASNMVLQSSSTGVLSWVSAGGGADGHSLDAADGSPTDAVYVDNSGNVGVGTLTPNSKFHIYNGGSGNTLEIGANPYSATSSAQAAYLFTVFNGSTVNTGSLSGIYNDVIYSGSRTNNNAFGTRTRVRLSSSGGTTNTIASTSEIDIGVGANSVTQAYAKEAVYTQTGGTVTDGAGLHVTIDNTGGTTTNMHGLYIEPLVGTNRWGIYQAGTNDNNFFGGRVGIGTSSPTEKLDVAGNIILSTANDTMMSKVGFRRQTNNGMGLDSLQGFYFNMDTNNNDTNSIFNVSVDAGASNLFTILSDGKVGIGTNNPGVTLDVDGGRINAAEICDENNANCKDISTGWGGGSGDFLANGTVAMTGAFRAADGSSGSPSISFSSDADTGFRTNGSNNGFIGISSEGQDVAWINTYYTSWRTTFGAAYDGSLYGTYAPSSSGAYHPEMTTISAENTNGAVDSASGIRFEMNNGTNDQRAWVAAVATASSYSPAIVFGQRTGATAYNERMRIDASGNVGIGSTAPTVELDVVGDINFTGVITDTSDRRLKENIEPLEGALDTLREVAGVSFTMKGDERQRTEFGVIAQDVEKVLPELVRTANDEIKTKSVNYMGFIGWIIEAIKELAFKNDQHSSDIEVLKVQLENKDKEIEELKSRLDKIESLLQNQK